MTNYIKTGFLLAAMTALFMGVGLVMGGQTGMMIALVVAIGMNFFSYWNSDKMLLKMHDAHEIGPESDFYRLVEGLAVRADLPMPRVYIMDNPQPNAFATGRNPENAAVAATSGIISMLSRDELAGVMAHELGHIKNRDILIMTMTATLAGAISMIAQWGMFFRGGGNNRPNMLVTLAVMILAPVAAGLVQMAISRAREYKADKLGAEICGDPMALAHALNKISGAAHEIPNETAEANPASAHMFIVNPLSGRNMDALFSTHPHTQNRIDALVAMHENWNASYGSGMSGAGSPAKKTTQDYSTPADRYSRPTDYYAKSAPSSGKPYPTGLGQTEDRPVARPTARIQDAETNPWGNPAKGSSSSLDTRHGSASHSHEDETAGQDNPWGNTAGNTSSKNTTNKSAKPTPSSKDPTNPWA